MKLHALLLLVPLLALPWSAGCAARPPTRVHVPERGVQYIEANGLRFAYLADGRPEDPLVLLLHGFPDTAHAWDAVRPALAARGFYVVSPFLRGYAPSGIPREDAYDAETLGRDVIGLIAAFARRDADVVGHDWGALLAYSAAALAPERVRRLVTLAIPHPATLKLRLRDIRRARHFLALRRRGAADKFARDDFAGVDELYERWSPTWRSGPAEREAVKNTFAAPGSLRGALGYYRRLKFKAPAFLRVKTRAPSLVIAGIDDGTTPLDAFDDVSGFAGPVRVVKVPTGHFPQRERPDVVIPLLLEFLTPPR
ncbi:MAG: alpha/beta hydrolase [Myxococcales bacterium]|nr:alpha/beta hydrolase [Myxococcales bacterium]